MHVLDLRDIAEQYRDELDCRDESVEWALSQLAQDGPHPLWPRLQRAWLAEAVHLDYTADSSLFSYERLCDELHVDRSPDALERYANDYEPTLIHEDDFEDYARELAEDIGALPTDGGWPAYCIDWEQAANELRQDYFTVEYDGSTYLTRSC